MIFSFSESHKIKLNQNQSDILFFVFISFISFYDEPNVNQMNLGVTSSLIFEKVIDVLHKKSGGLSGIYFDEIWFTKVKLYGSS